MKAKEKTEKKGQSPAELRSELAQLQEKLFQIRFKHSVTPVANPAEVRTLRRHAARLRTWIREKEAAASAGGKA